MIVRALLVLVLLLLTLPARAQDMIDPSTCTIHNAPREAVSWPIQKTIQSVEFRSARVNDSGVRLTLAPYNPAINRDAWPDFTPPGWDGTLRYTLWLFVFLNGQCHGSAFIEFWHDRQWTGAPLLTDYHEWVYRNPGSPWGVMADYVPKVGDRVGFMVTAGQHRMQKGIGPLKARSNIVVLPLRADGLSVTGSDGGGSNDPVPPPQPIPQPAPSPEPDPNIPRLYEQVKALTQTVEALRMWADERFGAVHDRQQALGADLSTLTARVDLLERRHIPMSCSAGLNLGIRIPIACRLE